MGSVDDIMQMCRLCLVKDQVNIPIFDENSEIKQTYLKISSCLPVKLSPEDKLPKNICDGCSCKLDMLYQFRKTSTQSERQLKAWIDQLSLTIDEPHEKVLTKPEVSVKEESFDHIEVRNSSLEEDEDEDIDNSYLMEQEDISYDQEEYSAFGEPSSSAADTSPPPAKRAKRAASSKKPIIETVENEEDDFDPTVTAKAEDASDEDSENVDQPDYMEAPSTSADDQPGPSGVNAPNIEAPARRSKSAKRKHVTLTIQQKIDIVQMLENGENRGKIVAKYNIGTSTISDIIKRKEKLKSFMVGPENLKLRKRQTLKRAKLAQLDVALYTWYLAESSDGVPITDDMIIRKAKHLHNEMRIMQSCMFSHGWLRNFKRRHEISPTMEAGLITDVDCKEVKPLVELEDIKDNAPSSPTDADITRYAVKTPSDEEDIVKDETLEAQDIVGCTRRNPFCNMCQTTFHSYNLLRKHRLAVHTAKKWPCSICKKLFKFKHEIKKHMLCHSDEKSFKCDLCEKSLKTHTQFVQHKREHQAGYKVTCEVCGHESSTRGAYYHHRKAHHSNVKYVCTVCGKEFPNGDTFRYHKRTHEGKSSYPCDHCERVFMSRRGKAKHTETEHLNQLYLCQICGKAMTSAKSLRNHVMIHKGDKPYACTTCGKCFVTKQIMMVHTRVHTKEKPHICEFCEKKFSQRTPLVHHIRAVHTGIKPYGCHICNQSFVSKNTLNLHLRSHSAG